MRDLDRLITTVTVFAAIGFVATIISALGLVGYALYRLALLAGW